MQDAEADSDNDSDNLPSAFPSSLPHMKPLDPLAFLHRQPRGALVQRMCDPDFFGLRGTNPPDFGVGCRA
jgi:hypothetical protein